MSRTLFVLGLVFDTTAQMVSARRTDQGGVMGTAFLVLLSVVPTAYQLALRCSDRLLNPPDDRAEGFL